MKPVLVPLLALVVLISAYCGLVLSQEPQLPQRTAIHFGADGRANGWTTRQETTRAFESLMVVPAIFVALALALRIMPARTFNLPHREYWLAPERRPQTVAIVSAQLIWMGCLLVLFLGGIYQLTVAANNMQPARLPMNWFYLLVAGFLGSTLIWTLCLLRRFYKIPAVASRSHKLG